MSRNDDTWFTIPDRKQCLDRGIALVLFLLAAGLYTGHYYFFVIALIIQVLVALWPVMLLPLAFLWFGFSKLMGKVMSAILLGLVFFLVVTPVGLIRSLMGKDRLMLKRFRKDTDSVFTNRPHVYQPDDLKHPY